MDCPGALNFKLGDATDAFWGGLLGRRLPLGGSFELTERCNLTCVHCYINQPAASRQAAARELTLPQVKHILDEISDAGCLFLLLTGGEILLRPDFCDIWLYAKQRGMVVSVFTNGTLLTPRIADVLAEWRPRAIEITLYGATQETYERVTGVAGSYARCMRGIELALDRGLKLNLKSVLLRANRHELEAMQAFAERLGVEYRFDGVLFPRLDGDLASLEQRLAPAEVIGLDLEYPERQQEYNQLYHDLGNRAVRTERVYTCGAGSQTFHIDCRGQMSLCMMARQPAYDLVAGSFQEGWDRFLPQAAGRQRTRVTPCTTCTVGVLCQQCPAWSQLVHGDDETPVDYVCEMGRLRAAQTVHGSSY